MKLVRDESRGSEAKGFSHVKRLIFDESLMHNEAIGAASGSTPVEMSLVKI